MKLKNILTITLLFLLLTTPASAYSGNRKVAINVQRYLLGILGAEYEEKLSNSSSYYFTFDYANYSNSYENSNRFDFSGGTRYYPQGQALQGFYAKGGANLAFLFTTSSNLNATGLSVAMRGGAGFQWIAPMDLSIDLGFLIHAPVYTIVTASDGYSSASATSLFGEIDSALKLGLGYVW